MKKFIIGLVVLIVLVFGGLKIFEVTNYGGTAYYTQIVNDGKKLNEKDDNGNAFIDYQYNQKGYDESGNGIQLEFNGNKTRPLKRNAYLKLTYNDKKGVTSWEAVAKSDVPKAALEKLNP